MSSEEFENVREVVRRLREEYPEPDLGNKEDPLEELVYIVLATRSQERYYRRAFERLHQLLDGDWSDLNRIGIEDLASAISESGLAKKKARTLKRIAARLSEMVGEVSLDSLKDMDTEEAESFLLDLYGVGPKTAKCVLMYSFDRALFPVDTHCARVAKRLGWLNTGQGSYTRSEMERIENKVPTDLRKSLHMSLVQHGKSTCTPTSPNCEKCSIRGMCQYYKKNSMRKET